MSSRLKSTSSAAAYIHAPSTAGEETHILSFEELRELILHGKTDQIPNNKDIPEKLNVRIISIDHNVAADLSSSAKDAPPSESTVAPPKKPWETNTVGVN